MSETKHASELDCWLIEAAWSREQPAYLGTTQGAGGYFFEWRFEAHRALKFATKQSADETLSAVRKLRPELFPSVVPYPSITEHIFIEDHHDFATMKHLGTAEVRAAIAKAEART